MICPKCSDEGLRSRVTHEGGRVSLIAIKTTYDEDGNLVPGRTAPRTDGYSCSNGHYFEIKS